MIDTTAIRDNYSRMTDAQLIHLAQTEGKNLTIEALNVLQEEFANRQLDTSIFETVEDTKTAQRKRNIEKAQDNASNEFIKSIWTYAFDSKREGITNGEIYKGLIERGLDEKHSLQIIRTLKSKAKENLDAHDTEMLTGGIICAVGLAITFWTYSSSLNGGSYIIAWGAIIFGSIRFFRGVSNKDKYKKILSNIEVEGDDIMIAKSEDIDEISIK